MGLVGKLLKASVAKKVFDIGRRELSKPDNQRKLKGMLKKWRRKGH